MKCSGTLISSLPVGVDSDVVKFSTGVVVVLSDEGKRTDVVSLLRIGWNTGVGEPLGMQASLWADTERTCTGRMAHCC